MTDALNNPTTARKVSRKWPIVSGATAVVLVLVLGAIIAIRGNIALEADAEWMQEILEHRNPAWEVPSLVMNSVGGGWFAFALPLAGIIVFLVLRRPWSALFVGLASAISAIIVQLIKALYGRPRPVDQIVLIDSGSFPSGHTANAATLAVVVALLFPKAIVWFLGAVYVVLMLLSRTYLGVHWLSDTIGGLVLGAAVAIIVWAPLASRLQHERETKLR
jgi:membrane-associated phospholipid phosphatase